MPKHNILVLHVVIPRNPALHAIRLARLIRELACSIQLLVAVLGHPDRLTGERSTLVAQRPRTGEHHLAWGSVQLIRHGLVGDGVCGGVVADFEDAVTGNICVCRG